AFGTGDPERDAEGRGAGRAFRRMEFELSRVAASRLGAHRAVRERKHAELVPQAPPGVLPRSDLAHQAVAEEGSVNHPCTTGSRRSEADLDSSLFAAPSRHEHPWGVVRFGSGNGSSRTPLRPVSEKPGRVHRAHAILARVPLLTRRELAARKSV